MLSSLLLLTVFACSAGGTKGTTAHITEPDPSAPAPVEAPISLDQAEGVAREFGASHYGSEASALMVFPLTLDGPIPIFKVEKPGAAPRRGAPAEGIAVGVLDGKAITGESGFKAILASSHKSDPVALASGWLYLHRGLFGEILGAGALQTDIPAPKMEGDKVVFVYANPKGQRLQATLQISADESPEVTEEPYGG